MFNNLSGKLKVWAIVITILGIASAIISGLSLMAVGEGFGIYGFIIIIVGILSTLITAWIIFGIGDLIDTSDAIYSKTSESLNKIERLNDKIDKILERNDKPFIEEIDASTDNSDVCTEQKAEEKKVDVVVDENGKINCPICGYEQDGNRKCCWKCGTKFIVK